MRSRSLDSVVVQADSNEISVHYWKVIMLAQRSDKMPGERVSWSLSPDSKSKQRADQTGWIYISATIPSRRSQLPNMSAGRMGRCRVESVDHPGLPIYVHAGRANRSDFFNVDVSLLMRRERKGGR